MHASKHPPSSPKQKSNDVLLMTFNTTFALSLKRHHATIYLMNFVQIIPHLFATTELKYIYLRNAFFLLLNDPAVYQENVVNSFLLTTFQ